MAEESDKFYLDKRDRQDVKRSLSFTNKRRGGKQPPTISIPSSSPYSDDNSAPPVYIAKTPHTGIPSYSESTATGTSTGLTTLTGVRCKVYRADNYNGTLISVEGNEPIVYNHTPTDVPGDTLIPILKDAYGDWYSVNSLNEVTIPFACGITVDSDLNLIVDVDALAGDGLKTGYDEGIGTGSGSSTIPGSCKKFIVAIGCGLKLNDIGEIEVDLEQLAGSGLHIEVDTGTGTPLCNRLAANPGGIDLACHLLFTEDEELDIDVQSLAGDGLTIEEEGTCSKLTVLLGCGLELSEEGEIQVNVSSFVGSGLKVEGTTGTGCPYLSVDINDPVIIQNIYNVIALNLGCGLSVHPISGFFQVELEDFDGDGLIVVTPEAGCKQLAVNPGCGLTIDEDKKVAIDFSDVAIEGISFDTETCTIAPDLGCGLTLQSVDGLDTIAVDYAQIAGDKAETSLIERTGPDCSTLAVDDTSFSTTTETLVNDVVLGLTGGLLTLTQTKTTYTNHFNEAGLHINRTAGSPVVSATAVDPCTITACCDQTGTGSTYGFEAIIEFDEITGTASDVGDGGVSFRAVVIGGTPPYTYAWSFGDGGSNEQNPTHYYADVGTYNVILIVTDACGNSAQDTIMIEISSDSGTSSSTQSANYCMRYGVAGVDCNLVAPNSWAGLSGMGEPHTLSTDGMGNWIATTTSAGNTCTYTFSAWDGMGTVNFVYSAGTGCASTIVVGCIP